MRWTKTPEINLSAVTARGLPTLGVGKYRGFLTSVSLDATGKQWIAVSTAQGSHLEQCDNEIDIEPGTPIRFEITVRHGAVALMQGTKYKLVDGDTELTGWTSLDELYQFVIKNDIVLAEPRLSWVQSIKTPQ